MSGNYNTISISKEAKNYILKFLVPVTIDNGDEIEKEIIQLTEDIEKDTNEIKLDLSSCDNYDSILIVVIKNLNRWSKESKVDIRLLNKSDEINNYINSLIYSDVEKSEDDTSKLYNYFYSIGHRTSDLVKDVSDFISFLGSLILALLGSVIKITEIRWKDFPFQFTKSGVNALGIVILILFLLGLITGYQGAQQLSQFGADIYIADLVGVSITRELAPIMTAIIIAGRSGSAFAAEIGTMKVSEEIDSLLISGFDLQKFLVLPRVLAVTAAMPLLTVLADFFGVAGGLVAAISVLDVTIAGYVTQLQSALDLYDIFTGLFKSAVFGFLIASIGCFRGMQVRGGAQSVGIFTTASVVTGILFIIIFDSLFTFVFQALGI